MDMEINLLPVKAFGERPGMCGPASLKMVLDYYGIEKSEEELAILCDTTEELGTSAEGIAKAAISLDFFVEIKESSSFEEIQLWLGRKVPVIVDWFSSGNNNDMADGHYSVVIGIDKTFIYLQDPELAGIRKIIRDDFLKVWFDFKGKYIQADELVIRQIIVVHR